MIRYLAICFLCGFLPGSLFAQAERLRIEDQTISWTGVSGVAYEVWYSICLEEFQDSGLRFAGGGALSFEVSEVFPALLPEKTFFQIRWSGFVDGDDDLMNDAWEQILVDADPDDAIRGVADLLPEDDFDLNGIKNYDEYRYGLMLLEDDPSQRGIAYRYQLNRLVSVAVTGGASVTFTYDSNQNLVAAEP